MEADHLSTSSIEDEPFHKRASGMKSESGESNIHRLQEYEETGHSGEIQNGSLKEPESRLSVCTIGIDSASNSSFTIGDTNLKASKSMLSLASISATCGSSSPHITSSEEELLSDLEDIGEKHEIVDNGSTQDNNQGDQKNDQAVHSASSTIGSNGTVQKRSLKVQEDRLSSNTIVKDSKSNVSVTVDCENLKASESMLSLTSTAATCCSSSSDVRSSEEEELGEQENISKKLESKHVWNVENPISGLPGRTVKHISNSLSATSFSVTQLERSLFQEDFNSLKSSDMKESQDSDALPHIRAEELSLKMPLSSTFACFSDMEEPSFYKNPIAVPPFLQRAPSLLNSVLDCISDIQEPFSHNNQIDELPLVGKASSLHATEVGTSEISDSGATPGVFPSATLSSGANLEKASQTTKLTFNIGKETSFENDLSSLKSPDMRHNPEAFVSPSLQKGRLSKHIKGTDVPSKMSLFSTLDCFSKIKDPSSHNTPIHVPPLVRMESSLNTSKVEASEISDCDTIYGVVEYNSNRENYFQKKDKSVGRKVKAEPPTSSNIDTLPTDSSAPSILVSSRKVGRALLQISKSLKQTSPEEVDWDLYENCGGSSEVKYFVPKPWVEELISSWQGIANDDAAQGLETENLLEEVHHFFENNFVDADVNLSREERKHRIITSRYFNDEFSRSLGLLPHEKLMKRGLKDLESITSPYPRIQLELLEMCRLLMEYCIPEETFMEFVGREILVMSGREFDEESISGTSSRGHQDYFNSLLFSIKEDFDFVVMVKLYAKLMYEGATYVSILNEPRRPSASKEGFRRRELLSKVKISSQVSYDQSTVYTDHLPLTGTLAQNEMLDTGCPANSEGDALAMQNGETHSRASKETSNVVSVSVSNELDSSVSAEDALCNEKSFLSPSEVAKALKSGDVQGTGKDGSNVSAEDFDSQVDLKNKEIRVD